MSSRYYHNGIMRMNIPEDRVKSMLSYRISFLWVFMIAGMMFILAGIVSTRMPEQGPFGGIFGARQDKPLPLDTITLPPGFAITVYADKVPNARSMALSDQGVLYVGSRNAGNVYAVIDENRDHRADRIITIAQGLRMPNGVAFKDGDLYVAEISRVRVYRNIEQNLEKIPPHEIISDRFPRDKHHGWKFIRFGPDGMLYVPVGAPCNVCERD